MQLSLHRCHRLVRRGGNINALALRTHAPNLAHAFVKYRACMHRNVRTHATESAHSCTVDCVHGTMEFEGENGIVIHAVKVHRFTAGQSALMLGSSGATVRFRSNKNGTRHLLFLYKLFAKGALNYCAFALVNKIEPSATVSIRVLVGHVRSCVRRAGRPRCLPLRR